MFVVTIDQRDSRDGVDRVPELLEELRALEEAQGARPRAGFERTVGDEVQALFDDAESLVAAVRCAVRAGGWHVGIGIGEVESIPDTVREGRGAAFIAARRAVEAAKKTPESVAVRAGAGGAKPGGAEPGGAGVRAAEALCRLVASIVADRTQPQREVVEAFSRGASGREVAASLRVTPQAVSQRRSAARLDLELAGWAAAVELLREADGNASGEASR